MGANVFGVSGFPSRCICIWMEFCHVCCDQFPRCRFRQDSFISTHRSLVRTLNCCSRFVHLFAAYFAEARLVCISTASGARRADGYGKRGLLYADSRRHLSTRNRRILDSRTVAGRIRGAPLQAHRCLRESFVFAWPHPASK